jgi:hypothetical protein
MFETIDVRFAQFHAQNPEVYETLVELAREARRAGKTKIGIKALWERARWSLWLNVTRDGDEPKLNNSLTSRYARLIMSQEPDLAGMFEVRHLRAA